MTDVEDSIIATPEDKTAICYVSVSASLISSASSIVCLHSCSLYSVSKVPVAAPNIPIVYCELLIFSPVPVIIPRTRPTAK
jgi:hypothetical protein